VSTYVAGLPMYDWPEVRAEVDALWSAIALRLVDAGIDAPAALTRFDRFEDLWTEPGLLIGETCGYNVATNLDGRVDVLGVLDHGVEGVAPGEYRSIIVARADDPAAGLAAFRDRTVAVNGVESWSGYASLVCEVAPLAVDGRFFGNLTVTGSHRASIVAVADGAADVAAIDAVAWQLALTHEPATDDLQVVALTDPVPAPPLVIGWAHQGLAVAVRTAVADAVASLGPEVRGPLDLYGFVERSTAEYRVLPERLAAAAAAGCTGLAGPS